jgi:hypothetical protein
MKTYDKMEDVGEIAKDVGQTARTGAIAAWANALTIARSVSDLFREVRGFDMDDALGLIGLRRRRFAPGMAIGSFSAGLVVGAGIGLLLAPKSGAETRHILYRTSNDLFANTREKLHDATERVTSVARNISQRTTRIGGGNGANPVS